ncbi:MAG: hypothetical protein HKN87_22755 [Saprospiraceae bacterium]|nr:hypothetical protein [Saprospiraceae bacterium]
MDFIEYTSTWVKSEVAQGRIMIGAGIILILVFYNIFRSQHELLKGTLIPISLLIIILIGYGGYILQSRPGHATESIELYSRAKAQAIEKEKLKHINDNKVGETLLRFAYPILMMVAVLILFITPNPYYKGMAFGFVLLFVSAYIIDHGFVSRSSAFLSFLDAIDQ